MRAMEKTQVRAKNASRDVNSRYRCQRKRELAYDLSILGASRERVLTVQHEDLSSNPQYSGKKLDMIVHAPVTQCCKGGTEDQWTMGMLAFSPVRFSETLLRD